MTGKMRARDLRIDLSGETGPLNAITDVAGIAVGYSTIIEETPRPGRRLPVRTGVTAVVPRVDATEPRPVYAGFHRFNGNGEMTGSHWIEDGGLFAGPVLITNTHSVGMVHHAAVRWMLERYASTYTHEELLWIMPVVAETYDGILSDINGQHVREEHVFEALQAASTGLPEEGCVGGGTGMIAYEWKGGTGTSSRRVDVAGKGYTVGALVQANHGIREWLTVAGVPVGRELAASSPRSNLPAERGSIIVVLATDVPLAPHQLKRLARRAALGIGRGGTPGGNSSGDLFLAFSTANDRPLAHKAAPVFSIEVMNDDLLDPVYLAAVESVEEAVLNAMIAARSMGGTEHDRTFVPALPHDALVAVLRKFGRIRA